MHTCSDSSADGRLNAIRALWRKNSKTLGFFPDGAFDEHAKKGWIIYLLEEERVVGYVLYRIAKGRAVIAHFCIDDNFRGKGASKCLFAALRQNIADTQCFGIEVRCRSDYGLSGFWEKLNFVVCGNMTGRGEDNAELTIWYYRLDSYGFFDKLFPRPGSDDAVWAVLDANVVFELQGNPSADAELMALMSDSVYSYSKFVITPIINNEINRVRDRAERELAKGYISKFDMIEPERADVDKWQACLSDTWKENKSRQDHSDMMHIAYAAAAGVRYFITQDQGIIKKKDQIYEKCGVVVLRPVDFVSEIYKYEDDSRYDYRSIARSGIKRKRPCAEDIDQLIETFINSSKGERKGTIAKILRTAVSSETEYDIDVYYDETGPVALYVGRKANNGVYIVLLRCNKSSLGKTLIQNLIWSKFRLTKSDTECVFRLVDKYTSCDMTSCFTQAGFIHSETGWIRCVVNKVIASSDGVEQTINALPDEVSCARESCKACYTQQADRIHLLEESFWPLKINRSDIPTYLIPIKPYWAMKLFDEGIANQYLLGADDLRFFSLENVYYSRRINFYPKNGARIVWYVSQSKVRNEKHLGGQIRACSRLIESCVAPAKDLYKQYQNLGIYDWKNMMQVTGNDPNMLLRVYRFYQTEAFDAPISHNELMSFNVKVAPQSPIKLTPDQFLSIYSFATNRRA